MKSQIKRRDMELIDDVLQMGAGYVLNFSDRTIATFFRDEFDVDIDADPFKTQGTSKAKRLRTFLQTTPPPLVGRVLQRLLEHRLNEVDANVDTATLTRYRALAEELGAGSATASASTSDERSRDAGASQAGNVLDKRMAVANDAQQELSDARVRAKRKDPSSVADAIGLAHVLAVGVSDYKPASGYGSLRQCVHDAKQVAASFRSRPELRSSAGTVNELTSDGVESPSRSNIMVQVRALATRAGADDRIVFYFSGHGQRLNEQLYLVPEDAWVDDDPDALISLTAVNKALSASQAKIKIVILDACSTGPDLSGLKHAARQWSETFLAEYIQKSEGVVTLASSLAEQPSSTKSPHPDLSLFTNFVVNALSGEVEAQDAGLLTVESMFAYVSAHVQRVSKSHHRPQQPAMSLATSGMIVLGDFRTSPATQSTAPDHSGKSEQAPEPKGATVDRGSDVPESLSRVLGFLLESTEGNVFHWSKELQHAASLQEQDGGLREINAAISARTYRIRPLHRKAVIEAAHETLETLQALTNAAVGISAKHGLLWVSITKSVKQLSNLYPYRPSESDNAPRLLVVGSDSFSLHFSELMAQLLQFLDGAAGVGSKPAPESPYAVTSPFEALTTHMVSRQSQTKGALVVPALWRMCAAPAGSKKWTRAKAHDAVSSSIPNTDGGTGRLTRWPVVLRPSSHEHTRDDSTHVWRVEYKGEGAGECHEEQLGVRTDGMLWFQRAHFWDAPPAQTVLELGRCAYDAIVFLKLLVGVGNQLGITSYAVDLCVEAPQAGMVTKIKTYGLVAKQPLRTARTRRRRYETHIDVAPMTSLSDAVQLRRVQELVDGIANELELAGDPLFRDGGKPFLEIEEKSIESVLGTFK